MEMIEEGLDLGTKRDIIDPTQNLDTITSNLVPNPKPEMAVTNLQVEVSSENPVNTDSTGVEVRCWRERSHH